MSKTIEQRHSSEGIVKAGEVIEIRHSAALTLHDKRILNLLIENAGPGIAEDRHHRIEISRLRGSMYKSSERVKDSIVRLMTTLVEVPTRDSKGKRATRRTPLLSETTTTDDEESPGAEVMYSFSQTVREIILKSRHWGRIKAYVMFAFSSKYALALYELLCLRGNLNATRQDFSVEDFRHLLGVPEGKLDRAPDLLRRVVQPAIDEVNGLSDFNVTIIPLREGGSQRGRLSGLRLEWERKSPEEWRNVLDELTRPKVGRKARLSGEGENIVPLPARLGWPKD